jgi:CheY-like chemotaxis protein
MARTGQVLPGVFDWGTVVLPRSAVSAPMSTAWGIRRPLLAPDSERGEGGTGPRRILMVEDDVALANMYALRLRRDGHDVTVVHDGESGLEHAIYGDYDLVFMDIGLPGLDGISILQKMRQSEKGATRPVVILSNYSEPPLIVRGEELGVVRYLVKSEVTPAEIAANIKDWVSS